MLQDDEVLDLIETNDSKFHQFHPELNRSQNLASPLEAEVDLYNQSYATGLRGSLSTIAVQVPESFDGDEDVTFFQQTSPEMQKMLNLINRERKSHAKSSLCFNRKLNKAALAHSNDMRKNAFFSHKGSDGSKYWSRVLRTNYSYKKVAENIACAPTIEEAHKDLMNSKNHRMKILRSSYEQIGIGITKYTSGNKSGWYVITQVFATSQSEECSGDNEGSCSDSPSGWYDKGGPKYDCQWYAKRKRCKKYGGKFRNFGKTAKQACCVCGGGVRDNAPSSVPSAEPSPAPTVGFSSIPTIEPSFSSIPTVAASSTPSVKPSAAPGECYDFPSGWYDKGGPKYDCQWYAKGKRCKKYGGKFRNFGKTAKQACCVCGGGIWNFAPTSAPTSTSAPVPAGPRPSSSPSAAPTGIDTSSSTPTNIEVSSTPTFTSTPTVRASSTPTVAESSKPTFVVSSTPTITVSSTPTVVPSSMPTVAASSTPTVVTSSTPTVAVSSTPTITVSSTPTVAVSSTPTVAASSTPTVAASSTPTVAASSTPSSIPNEVLSSPDFENIKTKA